MQHVKKRIVALMMTLAMLLSLMPAAFAADISNFPDMPAEDDPSYAAVKAAVDNGLLTGENGRLNLEGTILRSTISKIIASAFGAADEDDLSAYADVAAGSWYVEWLAKAGQMGIMHGSGGKMRPSAPMTRQEAYVVLSRALNLGKGAADDLKGVKGAGDLAAWAVPEVAPLVKAGYVTDLTAAGAPITRGEFVQIMHNIFSDYISKGGVVTEVGEGSVLVNVPGVTLKDCTVKGDLVVADGVGDGDVTLDNVTVEGRLVVRGGGVNSIHIINRSRVSSDVVVTKVNGGVRVFADATCGIRMITVEDGKDDVIIEGTVGIVTVASGETPVIVKNAVVSGVTVAASGASVTLENSKVNTVAVSASDATVELAGKTTVAAVQVDAAAQGTTVNAGADTRIETLKAGTDVTVDGAGEVGKTEGEGKVADTRGEEIKTTPAPAPDPEPSRPNRPSEPSEPSEPTPPAPHDHVWATEWSKDEGTHWHACTVSGCTAQADISKHFYDGENLTCACGKTDNGYDHEHTFDENHYEWNGNLAYAPEYHNVKCTVEGCKYAYVEAHTMGTPANGKVSCTKCGYETDAGCVNGHTYTTWTMDEMIHIGYCSVCGEKMVDGHTWGSDVVDGKVTCTAPGCGATMNVSVIPCEHEWVDGETTATCTQAGKLTKTCSKCGATQEVDDEAKGHVWGNPILNSEGTEYSHTCTSCGITEVIEGPVDLGGN